MDENTIFDNNNNQSSTTIPAKDTPSKISVQDLYGSSNVEPVISQTPLQNIEQPVVSPQADVVSNVEPIQAPVQQAEIQYSQQSSLSPVKSLLGNKKLVIGLAVGFILVFLVMVGIISRFFGSGNGSGAGNATLTYWGLWEENRTMEAIIDDFEKKNPGIKIKYEKQDPEKYKERLLTRVKNGTEAPDIFTFHNSWVPTLTNTSDNILAPLSKDVISVDEFKNSYYPIIQKDLTKKGAIYGLPQGVDTIALFINKDIFTAAGVKTPSTWEEFNTAAKSLTVKDSNGKLKTAGVALGTFDNITHASDVVALLMATNGVNLDEIDGEKEYLTGAINYYSTFAKGDDSVWDNTLINSREMFASGNLGMYFGYSWDIFVLNSLNKDLKFEVHPVPYLPRENGAQNKVTIASYWANGVSLKGKHQKEAFLFLKYLGEKETLQKIYTEASKLRGFGMPYARKDLAASLSNNLMVYPFSNQADYAVSTYFSSDTYDSLYNGPLNDYLGNTIREQITGGVTADESIDTLLKGVNQVRAQALR